MLKQISTKLKRAWIDFQPIKNIKDVIFKIKDYNRLESDYVDVLCHATMSSLSYPNYDIEVCKRVIDDKQAEHHYFIVKDYLYNILNGGGTIDDIRDYLKDL